MTQRAATLIVLVCFLLPCLWLIGQAPAASGSPAVVLRFEGGGFCSGTAVGRDIVLTAEHCLGAPLLSINGEPARVLETVTDGADHALLRVTQTFDDIAEVSPGGHVGQSIEWTGAPAGVWPVYRRGYIVHAAAQFLWIDAQVFSGDSGAGVMADGKLIAVVSKGGVYYAPVKMLPNGQIVLQTLQVVHCERLAFTAADWQEIRA